MYIIKFPWSFAYLQTPYHKPQCALLSLCAEIKVPALRVYYDEDHDRIVDVRWGLKVLTSEAEVTFGGIKVRKSFRGRCTRVLWDWELTSLF